MALRFTSAFGCRSGHRLVNDTIEQNGLTDIDEPEW